jgi:hypothetical protein
VCQNPATFSNWVWDVRCNFEGRDRLLDFIIGRSNNFWLRVATDSALKARNESEENEIYVI